MGREAHEHWRMKRIVQYESWTGGTGWHRGERRTPLWWKEWTSFSKEKSVEFSPEGDSGVTRVSHTEVPGLHDSHVPPPFWNSRPIGRQAVSR